MVLVITSVESREVLERWTFDIQTDAQAVAGGWVAQQVGRCLWCRLIHLG